MGNRVRFGFFIENGRDHPVALPIPVFSRIYFFRRYMKKTGGRVF